MKKIYTFSTASLNENERPNLVHVGAETFEKSIDIARVNDYAFTAVTEGPEIILE